MWEEFLEEEEEELVVVSRKTKDLASGEASVGPGGGGGEADLNGNICLNDSPRMKERKKGKSRKANQEKGSKWEKIVPREEI